MSGIQKITSDIAVGTSGKKVRIYGFIARATAGGVSVINIYDGTSTSGTLIDTINLAASTTDRPMYAGGLSCQSGCFVDVDANTSFVIALFEQENA